MLCPDRQMDADCCEKRKMSSDRSAQHVHPLLDPAVPVPHVTAMFQIYSYSFPSPGSSFSIHCSLIKNCPGTYHKSPGGNRPAISINVNQPHHRGTSYSSTYTNFLFFQTYPDLIYRIDLLITFLPPSLFIQEWTYNTPTYLLCQWFL